jgi:hypothetical protein
VKRHSFLSLLQVSYYEGDYIRKVWRERYIAWGRCEYRSLVRKADGKGPVSRCRWKRENNIALNLKEEDGRI